MITITVTINDHDSRTRCDAFSDAPEFERKCVAITLAGLDAILSSMESGNAEEIVAALIRPTIVQRLSEAGLG